MKKLILILTLQAVLTACQQNVNEIKVDEINSVCEGLEHLAALNEELIQIYESNDAEKRKEPNIRKQISELISLGRKIEKH